MTFEYNQESFWNAAPLAPFYQEDEDIQSMDHGDFYEAVSLNLAIETNSQCGVGLFNDGDASPSQGWIQSQQSSSKEVSHGTGRLSESNSFPKGGLQGVQAPRRPSAEAVARRKKQNRVSQAAWRARNKELVEELRQEINDHSEYSQSMHQTMQSLLETTESFKRIIVHALASGPPQVSQDACTSVGREEQLMSPGSSHGGPVADCERSRTQRLR